MVVRLSKFWEGSRPPGLPRCLIRGFLPPQLDEEEERRKRRREKNKVAAARCRNKKKERTEFLQRVRGQWPGWAPALSFRGLCAGGAGDGIPGLRNQCILPGISPGSHDPSVPTPTPIQCPLPELTRSRGQPDRRKARVDGSSQVPRLQLRFRSSVLRGPGGPGQALPMMVH